MLIVQVKKLILMEERSGIMSQYQKYGKKRTYTTNISYKGNMKSSLPIGHTKVRKVKNPVSRFYLLLFFTCIIMTVCILISAQYTYGGNNSSDSSLSEEKEITCTGFKSVLIVKGDNLNSLANKYFNEKDLKIRKKHIDRFINDTIQVNNLEKSGKIYAGGYLLLPQYN